MTLLKKLVIGWIVTIVLLNLVVIFFGKEIVDGIIDFVARFSSAVRGE